MMQIVHCFSTSVLALQLEMETAEVLSYKRCSMYTYYSLYLYKYGAWCELCSLSKLNMNTTVFLLIRNIRYEDTVELC